MTSNTRGFVPFEPPDLDDLSIYLGCAKHSGDGARPPAKRPSSPISAGAKNPAESTAAVMYLPLLAAPSATPAACLACSSWYTVSS